MPDFYQMLSDLGLEPDSVDSDFNAYYSFSDKAGARMQLSVGNVTPSLKISFTESGKEKFSFYSENLLNIEQTRNPENKMTGLYITFLYEKTDASIQVKLEPFLEVNVIFLAR
jgi:hypothetical protein